MQQLVFCKASMGGRWFGFTCGCAADSCPSALVAALMMAAAALGSTDSTAADAPSICGSRRPKKVN